MWVFDNLARSTGHHLHVVLCLIMMLTFLLGCSKKEQKEKGTSSTKTLFPVVYMTNYIYIYIIMADIPPLFLICLIPLMIKA